jgi:manganese/zinc/iron transport system substrate-binding protein
MLKQHIYKTLALIFVLSICISCGSNPTNSSKRPNILTTTGMIGDAVKYLTSDFADTKVMMGPGVDPHLFKASQGDMQSLSDADIIIYNGLHLEGKLVDIFEKTGKDKPTIAIGDYLDSDVILRSENGGSAADPHVWMDPSIWNDGIAGLSDTLQKLFPEHAESIQSKYTTYKKDLSALAREIDSLMQLVPAASRVLITSHDAFRYFGRAFQVEVKGLQGISTVSEYGLRDIKSMVDLIVDRQIKAVFVESSVSQKSLESVVEGCKARKKDVVIGGMLYSDSMGAEGTPDGTYMGMLRHNALLISKSLR